MRAICIARHKYLSEHLGGVLADLQPGLEVACVVGFGEGTGLARQRPPEVVFCDYDLLAAASLREWERDHVLRTVPIIAVSLTRRQDEAPTHGGDRVFGFLYLPSSDTDSLARVIRAASATKVNPPSDALRWSESRADAGRPR